MSRTSPRAWHRAELLFVITALLAFAFTLLARAAARLPHGGPLDQRIERGVHARLPAAAFALLRAVSFFGSTIFIVAGCLAVALVLGRMGARRRLHAFLLAIIGAVVWVQLFKRLFHRARPDLFDPLANAIGFSFPSGHSALAAAFFGSVAGLAAASSKRGRHAAVYLACGVAAVFLVGFSRVALGVHWPTDVLAGWAVGFGWLALVFAFAERQARRAREAFVEKKTP
ncbi:MAG TPA: phosphatase PAP2 family protein [Thermoanaerobaculia bacterium]|jgi:undecaprenyl-diphosphatase|nr:phosphatase PAP2 family protein [Thermoanaerobaculia bacterium]